MDEPKRSFVHVFPFTANDLAIYLLPGLAAPWRSDFVRADSTVHYAMEYTLRENGVYLGPDGQDEDRGDLLVSHSSSWHDGRDGRVDVYFAVIDAGDTVIDRWPDALPIVADLRGVIGLPPSHGATDAPAVRRLDPGIHSLRHLRALEDPTLGNPFFDATIAAKLDANWHRHLAELAPALSGLYAVEHSAA